MSQPYVPPRDPTEVLGRRFAAFVIDLFFLAVVGVIVLATAKHHSYYDAPSNACSALRGRGSSICAQFGDRLYVWERGVYVRSLLLGGLAAFLDLVVLQTLTGGSVGKLCVGLRVIEVQGSEARFLRMAGRWLFLAVDLGCFIVGLVTTIATHPHRRVGDLVCGTYVVGVLSVGHPVVTKFEGPPVWVPPPSGYGAPPGAPVPPGWGAPTSWSTGSPPIPVPTPPGTAPTTPGEWGAVARPGPALVRSPAWEAPPPSEPAAPVPPRGTTAPQWATPPVPKPNDADPNDAAPTTDDAPVSPAVAAQWEAVAPAENAAASETTSGPLEAPPSPWRPVVPVSSSHVPVPPTEPAPPAPNEPVPPPLTAVVEPETEPEVAIEVEPDPDDDKPWWDVAPSRNDR